MEPRTVDVHYRQANKREAPFVPLQEINE